MNNNNNENIRGTTRNTTLYSLVTGQARQTPGAVAVLGPGRGPLTYGGLQAQIDYVVCSLRSAGIERNDRVALVLPNGPDMAVAFLGTAAGATSAPLSPELRESEYRFLLSSLNARAVIVASGSDLPVRTAASRLKIPVIDLASNTNARAGRFSLDVDRCIPSQAGAGDYAEQDDIALVLHTSGTLSEPKIVPLRHRHICAAAHYVAETLRLVADDRCLNVMPLFHVHGLVAAVLASLDAGSSVVCSSGFSASTFSADLDTFRPTWYTAVPVIHQAVVNHMTLDNDVVNRHSLRCIRSATSVLPARLMLQLENIFKVPVIESYGMTEAASQITSNPLPPGKRKPDSVGLPVGLAVSILDTEGERLPAGQAGEIAIRGKSVMDGYEGAVDLNASTLRDDWLRTGDLGYLDHEGYLHITGRLKEMINRGGEKISPREIDETLMSHPGVLDAAAFPVPHPTLGEDIAAAVVMADRAATTAVALRDFAFSRLADHKVPGQIFFLDQIPRGPTGKLQRRMLRHSFGIQGGGAYTGPDKPLEEILASICAEVLNIEHIGIHDDFFRLGGDSLSATRVVIRIKETLGLQITVSEFFRRPTIAQLTEFNTTRLSGWAAWRRPKRVL